MGSEAPTTSKSYILQFFKISNIPAPNFCTLKHSKNHPKILKKLLNQGLHLNE